MEHPKILTQFTHKLFEQYEQCSLQASQIFKLQQLQMLLVKDKSMSLRHNLHPRELAGSF